MTVRLTERQEQVVDGIRRGQEYRAIAAELHVSVRTVESHVLEIVNRLPNPDGLPPYLCIFHWAWQVWFSLASDGVTAVPLTKDGPYDRKTADAMMSWYRERKPRLIEVRSFRREFSGRESA